MIRAALLAATLGAFAGCSPTLRVGGAYFPAWLACMGMGLLGTMLARAVFIRTGLDARIRPRALGYPAMALFFTLATFLIFFR